MNAPAAVLIRFLRCFGIGVLIGFGSDLIHPLRRSLTLVFEVLVSVLILAGWVYCAFGICMCDIRPGWIAGMFLGWFGWYWTAGVPVRRFSGWFWGVITCFSRLFHRPVE